ncbi:MAG: cytochrome c [Candidatus Margulisiibacteriota bacterium]
MMKRFSLVLSLLVLVVLTGCGRGYRTENTPVHLNPNLDWQTKFKAQTLPLTPPDNTVAWGQEAVYPNNPTRAKFLKADVAFYEGKTDTGALVARIPVKVTEDLLNRGQERFNIYCAMCHDRAGTGKGPVISRGLVPPPDFADPRLLAEPDGYFFNVITHGVRTMPSYAKQVPEEDRWAIVAYVRALQKSRTASISEIPERLKQDLK